MADENTILMLVPDIDGSSTLVGTDPGMDGDHTGWIPISSCSFHFSRQDTVSDAQSEDEGEGEAAAPVTRVDPITVKRRADVSTAQLLMWLANTEEEERKKESVMIDYCTPSGRFYLRYELRGVELVSSSLSFSAPDDLTETLTFTYDHITITQRPIDVSGEVLVSEEGMAEYHVFGDEE